MKSSKYTRNKTNEVAILAIVIIAIAVLLATQTVFAQIKIGGIKVDGINLPNKKDKRRERGKDRK